MIRFSRALTLLTLILITGAALRFHALGQPHRFHPDEAWFATFAREAALNGDWLLHGPLDKTPLSIYASALSMSLFVARADEHGLLTLTATQGEFAARLPNVLAGIVLIAVVYGLAQTLYGSRRVALWAAAFMGFSPYAIAFSATAFTDGLMLLFVTIGLWAACRARWGRSGFWFVLAFATKQQALFYVPLALALAWAVHHIRFEDVFRFLLPVIGGLCALFLWDNARGQTASLWVQAYLNNNPARLVRSDEVVPRLLQWFDYGRFLLGSPTPLFAVALPFVAVSRIVRAPRRRDSGIDLILVTFVLAYLLLHWLVAFNTYDRYLLPLLPPFVLLGARVGIWLWELLSRFITRAELSVAAAAVMLALLLSGYDASVQRLPFTDRNGSFPDYEGIDGLAEFLNSQSLGAIVYDHWLNWELGYYMGQWSDKRRVYYPTPNALAAGALLQPDPAPRYFPTPASISVTPWLDALQDAGFAISRVYETPQWVVYALIPPHSVASSSARLWKG